MDWSLIFFIVQVGIVPVIWHVYRKLAHLKENEVTHLEQRIAAIEAGLSELRTLFIQHLERHPFNP